MALIQAKEKIRTITTRFGIPSDLSTEIERYCDWVGGVEVADFFIQAAEYVLDKDKAWQKHKKSRNCATKQESGTSGHTVV